MSELYFCTILLSEGCHSKWQKLLLYWLVISWLEKLELIIWNALILCIKFILISCYFHVILEKYISFHHAHDSQIKQYRNQALAIMCTTIFAAIKTDIMSTCNLNQAMDLVEWFYFHYTISLQYLRRKISSLAFFLCTLWIFSLQYK